MPARKRYAQVGTGGRAAFFYEAIAGDYRETSELVAFCDVNLTRMAYANRTLERLGAKPVPTFTPERFDEMVRTTKPDVVVVTSIDRTHHRYIVRAMELGCDVISEKPMTVDEAKCQEILDAIARTGRKLRVTFNYRYSPHAGKIRELLRDGAVGTVNQVHFEWVLDTSHGADYFRRWHRDKRNSGGLLVHKATHHFDLVNFWLASRPKTVFAFGDLMFYGRENAEHRGVSRFYSRVHGSPQAEGDPFALHLEQSPPLKQLYLDAEKDDGYLRDQSVFGDGISIEDTMSVLVRYASGAMMSYSLVAYSPWEGFRVCFTGTKGRLEVEVVESSYVNSAGEKSMEGAARERRITLRPMFEPPRDLEIAAVEGGHGGGDPVLLNDLFGRPVPDPLDRAASHVDGAWSILTGIAANRSIRTGMPVDVDSLVKLYGRPPMIATLVNAAAVIAGSLVGLLLRGRLKDNFRAAIQTGAGVLTLVVGVQMAMKSSMIVALALSLIAGGVLGEWWHIEDGILRLGDTLRRTFRVGANGSDGSVGSEGGRDFAYGFLNASLLFCVGAMAIVGSFKAGTEGDGKLIYTKSVLDGAMAIVFTAAQGIGVAFAALSVLVYQGALTLLAGAVKPLVSDLLIAEITGVGGALLLMIGINLLGIARLKTANYLPAIALMVAFVALAPLLPKI